MCLRRLKAFAGNDEASTAVEYALIALVVSVSIVPVVSALPPKLSAIFSSFVGPIN